MRTCAVWFFGLLLAGCGGSSPVSPTPTPPAPRSITVTGSITETLSGIPIGSFSREVPSLPALIDVSAPGHVTRTAWITSATPTVDLIAEQGFDVEFYRQLARGRLDGRTDPIFTLTASPSIYLQTAGLTAANVAALEQAARFVVPALSGDRLHVAAWETGSDVRPELPGWIVVELVNNEDHCGLSAVGASAGHVWLNTAAKCARNGYAITPSVFAHELGHSLGFHHVGATGNLMNAVVWSQLAVSDAERHHAAIAYSRPRGNRDVDSDSATSSALREERPIILP